MSDLIARIRAEIDTDVRLANGEDEQAHNERHWPDRVERRAQAFRKILALHAPYKVDDEDCDVICQTCLEGQHLYEESAYPCPTLKLLAEAYGIEVEA